MPDIQVFGEADKDTRGKINSDYPAFYFASNVDNLKETIRQRESILEDTSIPKAERDIAKIRYGEEKTRLEQIEKARPRLSGEEIDWLDKCVKQAGNLISDVIPTYSEMEKKLVDLHRYNKIMEGPSIDISANGELIQFVRCLGKSPTSKGYISCNHLTICWKIGRNLLDMPTNVEVLRKDNRSGTSILKRTRV